MTKTKGSSKEINATGTQAGASVGDGNVVPTLLRDDPDPPHIIFLPLMKLAKMINEGSVKLAASPSDRRSAEKLKGLAQELDVHGLHMNIDKQNLKK